MDIMIKRTLGKLRLHAMCGILAAGLAGCAYYGDSDPNRTTGRVIDDKNITKRVAEALENSPVYKFPQVKVATFNGVVQLSGFVVKDEQKMEAAELARRVAGVTEVINNVSLAPIGSVEAAGRPGSGTTTR
jgi:osmotically-inducible protein OsmY